MSDILPSLGAALSFIAGIIAILLAAVLALKDRRSFANRSFIASLGLLALVELFRGLSFNAVTSDDALFWQEVRMGFASLLPGTCLLFSLSFARLDYRRHLSKWKYVILPVFALPAFALFLYVKFLYGLLPVQGSLGQLLVPLGFSGKLFYFCFLPSAVLILANLERTLRASTGRIRWQIKFIVLGMGGICVGWIYASSQALIYSALDTSLDIVQPAMLLAADGLFLWGLVRSRFLNVDVYLSRTTIQYSLTGLFAGIYLVVVGLLAYRVRLYDSHRPLPLDALFVILALAGLAMLILSDRLQERLRRVVTRHFRRPMYDYRKEWVQLTEKTNALVDVHELCTAVARILSQAFGILSVNIWLCDEAKERLTLAGSTVFTQSEAKDLERGGRMVTELLLPLSGSATPIDLRERSFDWAEEIMRIQPEYFREYKMRYALPLQTGGQLVGLITLNDDRVGKAPLSLEDQDLLHAYAAHLAARVLQLRLAENLRRAQEIEAFQNASAFFVHDLKNLASRLSLTMQNLPAYFDNPEFRADALKLIGESVTKIDTTCDRLSALKQKIELGLVNTDLNELLTRTLDEFERCVQVPLERDLQPLPRIMVDPEQLQKVVTNLVLNARDAINGQGRIRVSAEARDNHIVLCVTDDGCGMTAEFIERSLFRPFRSTKKRGMGIGLFHCKMIVEAHQGRIEAASQEGKGSTFRVILPVRQQSSH